MQTQTVSIVAGQPVHVTLAEDAEILDEVVVIGYQTVKRKDLTGYGKSLLFSGGVLFAPRKCSSPQGFGI